MTPSPGKQITTKYILPIISRNECNQIVKISQLLKCSMKNIFIQKSCRKWRKKTSSRLLLYEKALWGKSKWSALLSVFWYSGILTYNESKLYKISDCWSRDMLSIDFFEKVLGLVLPPHIVCNISRKIFLMLRSVNWPYSIIRLYLLLRYWVISKL